MIKINIGTSKGNIQNVEIEKDFQDISMSDIRPIVAKHFNRSELAVNISGWTKSKKQ